MDRDNLHHAYLVLGPREEALLWLLGQLGELGVDTAGNPDLFMYREDSFGVGEARALGARALEKAFTNKKVFVISPDRITSEAQNALLKTFEEPVPDTHFFLVVREEALVLPTLRSRMQVLRLPRTDSGRKTTEVFSAENLPDPRAAALRDAFSSQNQSSASTTASEFLGLSLKKRLAFAKKFADDERNLSVFLDDLLQALKLGSSSVSTIRRVYHTRRYASDRSASSRLVLEHLALVLK